MARATWSGSISFGLVNVPVKLFTATSSNTVRFHQLERDTGERIQHQRVAESSGDEVDDDDIVKGYEIDDGRHVIVEPDELEAVKPGATSTIEISDFVELEQVDPIYFDKTYYLAPADETAARTYRLLRRAMDDTARVAVGSFVMRTKQHLVAIRPVDRVLLLHTMFFADEVRDTSAIEELAHLDELDDDVDEREIGAAVQLVESLGADWQPDAYEDTYRQAVLELIERKAEGDDVVVDDDRDRSGGRADVIDLMAALEASVERAKGARASSGEANRSTGSWAEMTRDDLYDEAQRRDIAGRSSMTKQQLIDALRDAS